MITILTWFWIQKESRATYTAENVNIWADMVRRNLSMPHRIACVTDIPEGLDSRIEIIPPPGDFLNISNPKWSNGKPQCYRRLSMFRPDAGQIFGDRFVCMDMDCVIGGQLDPLFDRSDDLVLYQGTYPDRPYNGSMMLIRAGCRPRVFKKFNQAKALLSGQQFHGSDQAWLAYCLGWGEETWGEDDGVYWFNGKFKSQARARARVLFYPGKAKPWDMKKIEPYTRQHYRLSVKEAA